MNHLFKGGALINIEKGLQAFFENGNTDTYLEWRITKKVH